MNELASVLKCLVTQIVYLGGNGGKVTGINRRMSISTYWGHLYFSTHRQVTRV